MTEADLRFAECIEEILVNGDVVKSRNGTTYRIGPAFIPFYECPLITLRKCFWKGALREMEWFLSGSNNIDDLHDSVRHWWKPWADEKGFIHNNYSVQFRDSYGRKGSFDQIEYLLKGLREHPHSRRNVITTWNTADMDDPDTPITNCHGTVIQVMVSTRGILDLTTYQRSVDVMLGLPHNWFQYWALMQWLAVKSGHRPGRLIWIGGDVHIYEQHILEARRLVEEVLPKHALDRKEEFKLEYCPHYGEPLSECDFLEDRFKLYGTYKPLTDTRLEMVV